MTKPIRRSNAPDWEKYALDGSEDAHQIALFGYFAQPEVRELYPDTQWLFHIPNGGSRHKAEAGKLRAMGVKRGVPDICLPVRRGKFAGLWIELKKPANPNKRAGRTSSEQDTWITHLREQGFGAAVCEGWHVARDMIISYLNYKGE